MGDCAQALGKKTDGKVCGRFTKAKKLTGMEVAVAELTKNMSALPVANADLPDTNELYASKRYAFDIISDTCRFRLFSVVLKPVYPIELTFDEGVFKEMREDSLSLKYGSKETRTMKVYSDDGLMAAFTDAISTRKVKYLLRRLCEEAAETGE